MNRQVIEVEITVMKRTYKPHGWKLDRTYKRQASATAKRIYFDDKTFDRATGREIMPRQWLPMLSLRLSVQEVKA